MIKLFIFPAILAAIVSFYDAVKQHPITKFVCDDRPKVVMYSHFSSRLIHIDIECLNPIIIWKKDRRNKDYLCYQNINIFFFTTDFTLIHTLGWRYIPLEET